MPRQARLDAPGTLHHVIIRGIEKRKIVDDKKDQNIFVERMGQIALDTDTTIYAWALMTNHAHILLRIGQQGLSTFMRRFLTGYAINYNKRHKRYGHLFQNRYKSIVCDEDTYFMELVRYIHLNPLRANIIKDLQGLNSYLYSGHHCIMGKKRYEWYDSKYVLSWFGTNEEEAQKAYEKYMKEGLHQGRRPELVGGGLTRSLGGWSALLSLRKDNQRPLTDERVLGSGDFVEKIIKEADEKINYQFYGAQLKVKIKEVIEETCEREGVRVNEVTSGSRRGMIPEIRSRIVIRLAKELGIPLAEIGRQLGITTSSVSKILKRKGLN
jgi:putative transposase